MKEIMTRAENVEMVLVKRKDREIFRG